MFEWENKGGFESVGIVCFLIRVPPVVSSVCKTFPRICCMPIKLFLKEKTIFKVP